MFFLKKLYSEVQMEFRFTSFRLSFGFKVEHLRFGNVQMCNFVGVLSDMLLTCVCWY
jgi:hypothetical protein